MKNDKIENWIWLPSEEKSTINSSNFCVVKFTKSYDFNKPIRKVDIRTSGETFLGFL